MIMEHLLSLNPTGIWKTTLLEDAFSLVDSKMGNTITHAKGGATWAEEEEELQDKCRDTTMVGHTVPDDG